MTGRIIPEHVKRTQGRAADPEISAFVSANAGSGKTHVLVQRVIGLLLRDTPPEKILCITFTKAAAANMAERIFRTLGDWIVLDDAALDARLRDVGIAHPDTGTRRRARELFARALETPGGLKVQTIHALCTRLLQQFPFEANVPAHFTVLDDRDQADMIERASLATLLDAAAKPESPAGRALSFAMTCAADSTFRDIVREACLADQAFRGWLDGVADLTAALARLSRALGIAGEEGSLAFASGIARSAISAEQCTQIMSLLQGSSNAVDRAQLNRLTGAMISGWPDGIDDYAAFFINDKGEPRKDHFLIASADIRRANPALLAQLKAERDRLVPLMAHLRRLRIRDRTMALATIAANVLKHYRHEKLERGLLDYDDLIDKTVAMLASTSAAWVHYKLDRGIDHVLIDEAQDTSPKQWKIVALLVQDFAAGYGARGGLQRTMFAVGDEKQSIFSFQGAVPHEFDAHHKAFRTSFEAAGLRWDRNIKLNFSFRSGRAILDSVDHVFRERNVYASIHSAENGYPIHEALDDAAPSLIEVWPLVEKDEKADIEGWRAPFDAVSVTDPEVKLARRMADHISSLIQARTMVGRPGERRPLRPGDVMVLVRRRGKLFNSVIQALKHAGVPVAGADRLKLTEHIAIIDLMNLADALLLPQDDLALAVVLKSPLFGLTEEQLFTLAHGRSGSLRRSLAEHARSDAQFAAAERRLASLEAQAFHLSPFAFYARLLGADGGRARILKRLSHEASDALDEFLELAFRYGQRGPATLQGFVGWLRASETEIKRDMEVSRDEVRVMTVHGAKGLEAPVIYLMDTTSSPTDTPRLSLIRLPGAEGDAQQSGCVVWAGKKDDDPPVVSEARARMMTDMEDEYRRLLYVAMTRAAERLVIGGAMPGNRNNPREGWWYQLICGGLDRSDLKRDTVETDDGPVLRYWRQEMPQSVPVGTEQARGEAPPLPAWLRTPRPDENAEEDILRPSDAGFEVSPPAPLSLAAEARQRALKRGTLVHRLLQSLPDLAASERSRIGESYLARNAGDWSAEERQTLLVRTCALIERSELAALFAPGSRAEVPIAGRIARRNGPPRVVTGQIDRLAVTPDGILIADFKTAISPPRTTDGIPPQYLRQMALYRAVLGQLYPDRAITAALIWTESLEIMAIPASVLDREIGQIISS